MCVADLLQLSIMPNIFPGKLLGLLEVAGKTWWFVIIRH